MNLPLFSRVLIHTGRMVPRSLKNWFVIHFLADMGFAIPLLLVPQFTLGMFGWTGVDPLTARLVGAALFGIGLESWVGRNDSAQSYLTMLRVKMFWSLAANFGIGLTIYEGAPRAAWIFQIIFLLFSALWIFYWRKMSRTT